MLTPDSSPAPRLHFRCVLLLALLRQTSPTRKATHWPYRLLYLSDNLTELSFVLVVQSSTETTTTSAKIYWQSREGIVTQAPAGTDRLCSTDRAGAGTRVTP